MPRYNTYRQGVRGAVTPAQLAKGRMAKNSSDNGGMRFAKKIPFDVLTTDYVADGTRFKVELEHFLGEPYYIFMAIKQNNNKPVIVEDSHHGDDVLTLWFTADTLNLYVTVVG